jgi:hypothetical protein
VIEIVGVVGDSVYTAPRAREGGAAEALRRPDPTIAFTFGTFDQLIEATVTQERLIAASRWARFPPLSCVWCSSTPAC